jgi:hypothetical protein
MKLREAELFGPIRRWLEAQGYTVYAEVPMPCSGSHPTDVVGLKGEHIIAVELKTSLTKHLVRQCALNQLYADLVYAAVPTQPRTLPDKKRYDSIGVLRVNGDSVSVVREAIGEPEICKWHHGNMLQRLREWKPAGKDEKAGIPQLVGDGPAQHCWKAVQAYRVAHPTAKWLEIWQNVPNHYQSHVTMRQCMRLSDPVSVQRRRERQSAIGKLIRRHNRERREAVARAIAKLPQYPTGATQ